MTKLFTGVSRLLFIFLLFHISNLLQAQPSPGENPTLTKTIPASPNAASLGKFGANPVGYYTGVPQISIPLYEATSGDISVPVSLDYHAGGVKVEDLAPWVGTGWSLNAGGVITRTVRGSADDSHNELYGSYANTINYLLDPSHTSSELNARYGDVFNGRADTEPDIFYFNFGKYSGKFFIGEDGITVYTMPQQKISIVKTKLVEVDRWTITTPDGISYVFGKSADGLRNGIEYNDSYSVCDFAGEGYISNKEISSWFLVEINSPRGFQVTFDYDLVNYNFRTLGSESYYYKDWSNPDNWRPECQDVSTRCYNRNQMDGRRLKRINFLQGKVEFDVKSTYRLDVDDKALEYVRIFSGVSTTPFKYYKFYYSYFGPGTIPSESPFGQGNGVIDGSPHRLKLLSLTEYGSDNSAKSPYFFYYNETQQLPRRIDVDFTTPLTWGQDHWGYFNGRPQSLNIIGMPTLIPTIYADFGLGNTNNREIKGAERASIEPAMLAGSLEKIVYPTGGSTEFVFKANKVPSSQFTSIYLQPGRAGEGKALMTLPGASVVTGQTFVVNSTLNINGSYGAFATVYAQDHATGAGACTTSDPAVTRTIYKASDNSVVFANGVLAHGAQIFIPNGSYYIKLEKKPNYNCTVSIFDFKVNWTEYTSGLGSNVTDAAVGGLRVEKITDYDGIDHGHDKIRVFKYQKFSDPSVSSGALVSFPRYNWAPGERYIISFIQAFYPAGASACTNVPFECPFFVWQSNSNYTLATTQGSVAGYTNVTVEEGLNGINGKTEYTFTSADGNPDLSYSSIYYNYGSVYKFPFPSFGDVEWRRGVLMTETTYKNSAGIFAPVKEVKNYYNNRKMSGDALLHISTGLKVGAIGKIINTPCEGGLNSQFSLPINAPYDVRTEWPTLDSTETKMYDVVDGTKWATTTEIFEFKPTHLQLWKKTTRTSKRDEVVENYTYPEDYSGVNGSSTGNAKGIYKLQTKKMYGQIIENYVVQQDRDGANAKVLGGAINTFIENPLNINSIVSDATYSLESVNPIPVSGAFVPSTTTSGSLVFDPNYKPRINYLQYDAQFGNLKLASKTKDVTVGYVWGYTNSLPIAEITNGISDMFYHTSFEEDGVDFKDASNNSLARTGTKVWNSGSFSFSGKFSPPTTTNLKMSYSYYDGTTSKWIYSGILNYAATITTTGTKLDEVRVFTADATMTTYTYDPVIGMTSSTDANNNTTYYEYDSFGRLKLLRDFNKNIVKRYTYQ